MLTQEEWNEKQRNKRKSEFSWDYDTLKHTINLSNQHLNKNNDDNDNDDMIGPSMDLFYTPNNPNKQSTMTSKGLKQPIRNELDDEPVFRNNHNNDDLDSIPLPPPESRKGVEIAPPPTYEYYGPSGRGPKLQNNFISVSKMQDSILKGYESKNNLNNKPQQIKGIIDD